MSQYESCPKCAEHRAAGQATIAISQSIPGGVPVEREVAVTVMPDKSWKSKCLICGYEWRYDVHPYKHDNGCDHLDIRCTSCGHVVCQSCT